MCDGVCVAVVCIGMSVQTEISIWAWQLVKRRCISEASVLNSSFIENVSIENAECIVARMKYPT
jgi:hypothetical protein